jgi:hypothetical protein
MEAAGVEFIDENGGGPGVRLKKTKREATEKIDRRRLNKCEAKSAREHRTVRLSFGRFVVERSAWRWGKSKEVLLLKPPLTFDYTLLPPSYLRRVSRPSSLPQAAAYILGKARQTTV